MEFISKTTGAIKDLQRLILYVEITVGVTIGMAVALLYLFVTYRPR